LGAADTFRAAAIEQLTQWAIKLNIPIVSSKQGHDPSAVAYDTIESAKAKGAEHVIIDTAGRLHTQTNLGNELKKIVRICDKAHNGAPHRKILVLDGTQGSSAIAQAKAFHEMIDIDGIIITKLDGTARGGSLFSIAYELKIPILYIGVGEQPEHLLVFDKYEFVTGLLDIIYFDEDEIAKKVTKLSEDDVIHVNFEAQMKLLHQRINNDGFDVLSRHFVREQSTWNEYRLAKNENNGHYEILARDGGVLKSYVLGEAQSPQIVVVNEPQEVAEVLEVPKKLIHKLSSEELKTLHKKINADGYDILSKHFVRDQRTWDEYKFVTNEQHNALEILNRDGSIRHSYGPEILEDAEA
jgi:fused signal recognition particle receptor